MTRGNPVALTDAEEVVALTRIRVENLTEALVTESIDRGTYAELAAFLEGPAWRACDALGRAAHDVEGGGDQSGR